MRKASIAIGALGVLLLIAAVVVRWVVAPAMVKLPDTTDETRTFVGTASALLNPTALASGATSNVVLRNVPVQATHQTKVLESTSGSSLIEDKHALSAAGTTVT